MKKKKMKRYGGAGQFFHHLFWGAAVLIGIATFPGTFSLLGESSTSFIPFLISLLMIFLGIRNIVKYNKAKHIQQAQLSEQERVPKGSPFLILIYLVLAALTVSAACTFFSGIRLDLKDAGSVLLFLGQIAVALFGLLMIWFLTARIRLLGFRDYWAMYMRFFADYVPLFTVFQLSFALLSFICNSAVLLTSQTFGDTGLIVNGYFLFISEGDTSGGIAGFALSSIASLTGASSYFVLSTFAQVSVEAETRLTLAERFKRMLHDSGTRKLLIMTVLCLVISFISSVSNSFLANGFFIGCCIIWLVSQVLFLKDTKLLWYAMNYSMMIFMEYAIPSQTVTGFGTAVLSVVAIAVRILLFSFIAMLIGHEFWLQELREKIIAADPSLNTGVQRFNKRFYDLSILNAGFVAANLVINRKEIVRTAARVIKDAAVDKLTDRKEGK